MGGTKGMSTMGLSPSHQPHRASSHPAHLSSSHRLLADMCRRPGCLWRRSRPSMRLRFIISVAAGFLCGDLVAAAQTYSPNDPYWLRPNPTHGGLSTEDYYLPGAQRAPRGTVRSRRPSVMPSDADPAYSSAE